ncbi:MAG TPA: PAS domain S-box protein, partial [Coleofasciculaceae cyanobacterium]
SLDGQFLQINQAFQQVMGVGKQGLAARSWSETGHPDDQTTIAAALQQLQRGQAVVFEARCSGLQNNYHWLEWHATVDSDVIYAIGHDITDRRQQEQKWRKSRDEFELRVAERTAELVSLNQILQHELDSVRKLQEERNQVEMALRFSQARFAGILEIADDAIISVNQAQQITLFNQGAEKIFGYTSAEVLNQPLDILLPSALASIHRQHVRDFAASSGEARRMGERRAIFGRRKDGSEFPAEASISCLNLGEERLFTVILRDSTERQRDQDALQQSEERLRLLLDGVEDYAIFMLDPSGHVESWNPGAEKVQGYQAQEIIGQNFACFFLPDDRTAGRPAAILEQALQEGRLEVEGWRLRADRSRFYADTVITALKDGNGKLRGFTEITRDITDARQREAERQAIERMKDEFVSMVSHELRTPLTSIHGSLRMLSSGLLKADTERSQRLLQIASDSTDRLVRLINDILDLERIESGKVSLVKRVWNLADLIAEAVDGMQAIADKAGIRLSVTTIAVDVYVDRDRIIQTLTNLLSNAIKFSPKESTVQIRVERSSTISRRSTQSKEKKTNRSKASALLVTVQDQGRGIPPDKLETIFERFQQVDASDSRHQDGTGLGLAICRSIINQHGGQIWATSVLGEGSAFYFTLPLQRQEPERT